MSSRHSPLVSLAFRPARLRPLLVALSLLGLLTVPLAAQQFSIGPQGAPVSAPENTTGNIVTFEVQATTGDFWVTGEVSCSGAVIACTVVDNPVWMGSDWFVYFYVSYSTAAGGGTGTITFTASGGMYAGGEGSYDVTVSLTPEVRLLAPVGDVGVQNPTIQIAWCDDHSLNASSRWIKVDGVVRTSSFNYVANSGPVDCTVKATSSTSALALGVGSHHIEAHICDDVGACATKEFWITRAAVAVRPELSERQHFASTNGSQRFFVKNVRTVATTLTLDYQCTGTASGCAVTPTSLSNVAPGESRVATLTYSIGAAGPGTAMLKAYDALVRDSASLAVTAVGAPAPVISVLDVNPGAVVERDLCLTVAAGSSAAFECGDLRIVHELPAVRMLNKLRVPTLLYNSAFADPYPIVAANVTLPAGSSADSVEAVLTVGGVEKARARWDANDWAPGATRRIALGYSAASDSTSVYDYTLEVATIDLPSSRNPASVTGKLIVVNRRSGGFGAGWWLAGLERLEMLPDGNKLWVGGDGSARLYSAAGTDVWVTANVDRPDTLKRVSSRYLRRLPGGVTVQFNSSGRHDTTVNRLGHKTSFTYEPVGGGSVVRLRQVMLPSTQGCCQYYTFNYDANDQLASVVSHASLQTRTTNVWISALRVDSIRDPNNGIVRFGYDSLGKRVTSRVDRRGTTTSYSYDAAAKLWRAHINLQPDSIRIGFRARDVLGLATALPKTAADTAIVYTSVFGGRHFDTGANYIAQETKFWLDRYGAPRLIRNPLSHETRIRREEGQYPALATELQAPNAFLTRGHYDGRGNIVATIAVNPLGPSQGNAVTRYHWDPRWDFADSVITPTGRVTAAAYDAINGNRLWQQLGTDPLRRVTFRYGNTLGLASSTVLPNTAPDSLEYDPRGNLSMTRSPMGYETRYTSDVKGRVTVVEARVDTVLAGGGTHVWQKTLTDFDAIDRDTLQRTIGPALGTAPAETVYVRKFYNPNSQLDSLWTWSGPDVANVDTIRTRWLYDRGGRRIYEIASNGLRQKWTPDDAGNVVADSTRRGHVITMVYNALNRLTTRSVPAVSEYTTRASNISFPSQPPYPAYQIPAETQTFTYDEVGLLMTADNADAKVRRTYYPGGLVETDSLRIQTVARDDWGRHKYGIHNTYDLDGRRTSLAFPEQLGATGLLSTMTFGYDPQSGALQTVHDPEGNPYTFGYSWRGELRTITYPAQYSETFTYDADGRLTADTIRNLGGTTFPRLPALVRAAMYRYDARGNLMRSMDPIGYQDTLKIGYSGLGHVVTSKLTQHGHLVYGGGDQRVTTLETWTFDGLGNRTDGSKTDTIRLNGAIQSILGPANHPAWFEAATGRITRDNQTYFYYDAAGNTEFTRGPNEERATFYGADGKLRAADWRWSANQAEPPPVAKYAFEEYRYDALGRRVWVWSKKSCVNEGWLTFREVAECKTSLLRRTIWDGSQELAEVQMPGGTASNEVTLYENDEATVQLPDLSTALGNIDRNQYFGRVLYTPGRGIDQPIAVTRINYEYQHDGNWYAILYKALPPITTIPFWNRSGDAQIGVFTSGARLICESPPSDCVGVVWPYFWSAFDRRGGIWGENWHGTVLESKRDKTNLSYNRNRYYDPQTGRFTQEDPIGLAGGLNLYGFANGDPINFSDPFGLKIECNGQGCALWNRLVRLAAEGMRSDDRRTRFYAGELNKLLTTAWESKATYRITAKDMLIMDKVTGGGYTRGSSISLDPEYYTKRWDADAEIGLAHELGHAVANTEEKADLAQSDKASVKAEDSARNAKGCKERGVHEREPPKCP